MAAAPSLPEVAERIGVSPSTLRRWLSAGVIPGMNGSSRWSPAAISHARIVARLRERGHTLDQIREASRQGRLAYGFFEELFPEPQEGRSLAQAAKEVGLEPALVERLWTSIGFQAQALEHVSDEELEALRHIASLLDTGFPLVAVLQLCRVYGQALAQIADTEVRLFHIYVHEPLMRDGVPGLRMAEQMETLTRDALPFASPLMDFVHQRFLQHYATQDVVGHMELDLDGEQDLDRLRVAIAFADLAGYTRFTEEEGEEEALSSVERFVEGVTNTLPDEARVVKTIGDEVMVVGSDPRALVDWAVGFVGLFDERPEPRIGVHYGAAVYRDGDYFGREVNLASRVVARARGGEVLVTDTVVDAVKGAGHLSFEGIGQVKLKGFDQPRQLCRAVARE
ncbi:MAG TPA: MerR family transcriptional regulator [Thermoleophilaceae bacterium]